MMSDLEGHQWRGSCSRTGETLVNFIMAAPSGSSMAESATEQERKILKSKHQEDVTGFLSHI